RPRVRSADGEREVALATYAHFADRDPLTALVLERMLAGVSTRRYRRVLEPVGSAVGQAGRSTSGSSVGGAFAGRTRGAVAGVVARRPDDVRLAVVVVGGVGREGGA